MDARKEGPSRPRAGKAAAAERGLPAGNTVGVVDGTRQDTAAQPAKGPLRPAAPTVHGETATELMLQVRTGEQAWLLTSDGGNHEFGRVHYFEGRYRVGSKGDYGRLGPFELVACDLRPEGLEMTWAKGANGENGLRKSFIPKDYFQYTWY